MSAIRFHLHLSLEQIVELIKGQYGIDVLIDDDPQVQDQLSRHKRRYMITHEEDPPPEFPVIYEREETCADTKETRRVYRMRLMRYKLILPSNETEKNARLYVRGEDIIDEVYAWLRVKKEFRCVVPCQGFYVFTQTQPKSRLPHYVRPVEEGKLLLMAGIYCQQIINDEDKTGAALLSVSPPKITEPHGGAPKEGSLPLDWRYLGARHPLFLNAKELKVWLRINSAVPSWPEEVKEIVRGPHKGEEWHMKHHNVSNDVKDIKKESEKFIKAIPVQRDGDLRSFFSSPSASRTQSNESSSSSSSSTKPPPISPATLRPFPTPKSRQTRSMKLKVTVLDNTQPAPAGDSDDSSSEVSSSENDDEPTTPTRRRATATPSRGLSGSSRETTSTSNEEERAPSTSQAKAPLTDLTISEPTSPISARSSRSNTIQDLDDDEASHNAGPPQLQPNQFRTPSPSLSLEYVNSDSDGDELPPPSSPPRGASESPTPIEVDPYDEDDPFTSNAMLGPSRLSSGGIEPSSGPQRTPKKRKRLDDKLVKGKGRARRDQSE